MDERSLSQRHQLVRSCAWDESAGAERILDDVYMSRGTSNAYVVASAGGDVVINTGTVYQGPRVRERFEQTLGRALDVQVIVFTQSHPDHIGGWSAFAGPQTTTLAQSRFADCRLDRTLLAEFFEQRRMRIVGGLSDVRRLSSFVEPELSAAFDDSYRFEVGDRAFELYATPGGETLDSLVVWLPAERMVFVGNLLGALYGALPHLYTLRGDRLRSAREFIRSVDRVLALEPEVLVTGHDEPIWGAETIRRDLTKVRDAVAYIHDETVAGMNAGKDLHTLMAEISLPEHLQTAPGRGPVRWYVRAVWEEYAGWFRFESTTELYEVPARAIWPELAELAGADALAERAANHAEGGRPVEALHFTDIVLAADPDHLGAREAQIRALETLLEHTNGEPYDEITWLESELAAAREARGKLAQASGE